MDPISFYFWAIWMIVSALAVLLNKNIMRSAVALLGMFLGLSALFLLLNSSFLAMMVILILIGAVGILFLFSIMLIGDSHITLQSSLGQNKITALIVSGLFFAFSVIAIQSFDFSKEQASLQNIDIVQQIGNLLLTDYLFHFEFISIVLLVALIATIVIARKD